MTEQMMKQVDLSIKLAALLEESNLTLAEKVGVLAVVQQSFIAAAMGKVND